MLSAPALAQEAADDAEKPATNAAAEADDEAEEEEPAAKTAEADAATQAAVEGGASAEASAKPSQASAEPDTAAVEAPTGRSPVFGKRGDWFIEPYGYARMDAIGDTTQSFEDGIQPNLIARPGTYKGQHRRMTLTARDSRIGIHVGAPTYRGLKSSAQVEFDFFGMPPTDARQHDAAVFGPVRMRHAFFKLETPVVDVIAGQYYTLFGWNGHFYPATAAFLGVPAQVYHRDPQVRLEKALELGSATLTFAVAGTRPGQRDSGVPDANAGLLFELDAWSGAAMSGFGRPSIVPLSIGASGLYRRFELPQFRSDPGYESVKANGYGITAQAILPVIPASSVEDRGNALTLTGEFSTGTGIADMYTGMDGGSRLPLLPNPSLILPAKPYPQNIDPGLVTFDRAWQLKTINWRAFVVGAQYYLPIGGGAVSLSGVYSRVWSDNLKELTPNAAWGAIFTKMEYIDATLGIEVLPWIMMGVSFQTVSQTFADVSPPEPIYGALADDTIGGLSQPGTGGVAASARNNRGQLTMAFFF